MTDIASNKKYGKYQAKPSAHLPPDKITSEPILVTPGMSWCEYCNKFFKTKNLLQSHYTKTHDLTPAEPKEDKNNNRRQNVICPLCFLPQHARQALEDHLQQEHEIELEYQKFIVDSLEALDEWRKKIETETNSHYVRRHQPSKGRFYYYSCNRSGSAKYKNSKNRGIRNRRKLQDIGLNVRRIGACCPARIKVDYNEEGTRFEVDFCSTHVGHALDEKEIEEKRKNLWKTTLMNEKKPKAEIIPKLVLHDQTMMEHDYFCWSELIDSDEETNEKPNNHDDENYNTVNKNSKPTTSHPKKNNRGKGNERRKSKSPCKRKRNLSSRNNKKTLSQSPVSDDSSVQIVDSDKDNDQISDCDFDGITDLPDETSNESTSNDQSVSSSCLIEQQLTRLDQLLSDLKTNYNNFSNTNRSDWQTVQCCNQKLIETIENAIISYTSNQQSSVSLAQQQQSRNYPTIQTVNYHQYQNIQTLAPTATEMFNAVQSLDYYQPQQQHHYYHGQLPNPSAQFYHHESFQSPLSANFPYGKTYSKGQNYTSR